jgi:hypothetical protein
LLLGAGELVGVHSRGTLPAKIMENFGFCGQSVTLVLTERGGRLLCQQAVPVQFEKRWPERNALSDSLVETEEPVLKKMSIKKWKRVASLELPT